MPESSAEYHLYWDELHRDCRTLAQLVLGQPWIGIAGIARGGVIPATILARELGVRLLDTLCITSYSHDRQGEVEVLKSIDGDGAGWLIVDDLVDTGGTAKRVRELLPAATLAAVYAKPKGKPLADYYAREFPQHTWLHFPWDNTSTYSPPLAGTD